MRWQRIAQAAIALFVIGFIALLVNSLRRERAAPPEQTALNRTDPKATVETPDEGVQEITDPSGRKLWQVRFGIRPRTPGSPPGHLALPDGRQRLARGVEATINRPDGQFKISSDEADITVGEGLVKEAVFRKDVRVGGAGGLEVKSAEATYTEATGIVDIPGKVEFSKGRMTGSGRAATYDQKRDVFWIREQAHVNVAPGSGGEEALEATAGSIGMARAEHYIRLERDARITGNARVAQANDIVIRLTADDQRVQRLELRGNSRITGGQAMSARDIDMTYGEDGRTLQQANLVENSVVELPGPPSGGQRRIAANTIDIGLAPDGATVTSLAAAQRVQVDLPAEGDAPVKTIRSAALTAAGTGGGGLQGATFSGGVEYRETRAARRNVPAVARVATSQTLDLQTQPGLGPIQKADFRGNVRFMDPPDFVARSQQAIYDVASDRLELMPAAGQPGPEYPTVTDGKVSVEARAIHFGLSTRDMKADTRVGSTIQPQARRGRGAEGKLPSMLSPDEPVAVRSNQLVYNGATAKAVYSGNVILWQGVDTKITAPSIEIDDKSGNLKASGGVTTTFVFQETDRKTGARRVEVTRGTSDTFTYDDNKRLAIYTVKAQIIGLQGVVNGDRIELFMKAAANELERAEAYGANGVVKVREGNRLATGSHLTYTAVDDQYLLVGTPVEVIEMKDGVCRLTRGHTATFNRATEQASIGSRDVQGDAETLKACPAGFIR